MVSKPNIREDVKTQNASQPAIDKDIVAVHKNGFDVLKSKSSLTEEEMDKLDNEMSNNVDWEALKQEAKFKPKEPRTNTGQPTKPLSVAISVKKLFANLGNPETLKYNFDFSKVRDTEFGRSAILTSVKHNLALFINLDKGVLGQSLETKGYTTALNIGSSGYIVISKIVSKEAKMDYFVLDDIKLTTKHKNATEYEL